MSTLNWSNSHAGSFMGNLVPDMSLSCFILGAGKSPNIFQVGIMIVLLLEWSGEDHSALELLLWVKYHILSTAIS
ncbi:hypothetical protein Cni_G09288 [Canna indica]|uniref:Uncharacterized protein n=1 Tax=Canna indica TaxID=4628 RepID=A0AAQ3K416_9LILI|nr:hypothetical protein Cni_G09288 [Canna indica]